MKSFRILFLILFLPIITVAQNIAVTGKISSADTKSPIAGASVFLSNSSFGTSTANNGTFTLNGLKPGQYSLIVTTIGYEDYTQILAVNTAPVNLNIELRPKTVQLKEVVISNISKADRKLALEQFKQDFIGTDQNALDCKIVNPQVLNFTFSQNKTVLEAYTDELLIIENNALGYRIKFLLKTFKSELLSGNVAYSGSQFFEEMKGGDGKKKRWYKKRDEAYYGSAMHFYRALYKDSLADAGFKVYRLARQVNSSRPTDEEIEQNLDKAKKSNDDSYLYWTSIKNHTRYTNQKFKGKFAVSDILKSTERPGLLAITFTDNLYVVYTKRWETNYYKDVYRIPNDLNYETTIVSYVNNNQAILIDRNGTIIGNSPLYEGTWSKLRLSTLLPVDYAPYGKQPMPLN